MAKANRKPRGFNTDGLCLPELHYMINPLKRIPVVGKFITNEIYFAIQAPRLSGKTTYLYSLARKLNDLDRHIALVVSFERAGGRYTTPEEADKILLDGLYMSATRQLRREYHPPNPRHHEFNGIADYLKQWCRRQSKPVVLLIDDIDALEGDVFFSVLSQLREGFQGRPAHYPASIILAGLRDVREYSDNIRSADHAVGTGGSPFNLKNDSLLLKYFSREEVDDFLEQHTEETGQVFPAEVKGEIHRLTGGQPWLVNALVKLMLTRLLRGDVSLPITMEVLRQARREFILRRDSRLDSLVDRLKERRVKRIVQAIVNGDSLPLELLEDDLVYVRHLGIVGRTNPPAFANPLFAEIIPRAMAYSIQSSLPAEIRAVKFLDDSGQLDMDLLLHEFQQFYRNNGERWVGRYEYNESVQQLMLMSFLQRVTDFGGDLTREMAVGNCRLDLLVEFKNRRFALEFKVLLDKYAVEEGKENLVRYLDCLGFRKGYLVLFDPEDKPWEDRLYFKDVSFKGKTITMVGL